MYAGPVDCLPGLALLVQRQLELAPGLAYEETVVAVYSEACAASVAGSASY